MACLINLLNNGVNGVDGFDGVNGVFDNLPSQCLLVAKTRNKENKGPRIAFKKHIIGTKPFPIFGGILIQLDIFY